MKQSERQADSLDLGLGRLLEAEEVLLGVEAKAGSGALRRGEVSGDLVTLVQKV